MKKAFQGFLGYEQSPAQQSDAATNIPRQRERGGNETTYNAQFSKLNIKANPEPNPIPKENMILQADTLITRRDRIAKIATKLSTRGGPQIYVLNLKPIGKKVGTTRKMEFGNPAVGRIEKTVMLLGATGSGKTTLINGMVNYILGVEWNDDFRVKLIEDEGAPVSQAESQTSFITSYTIHHQPWFKVPYTLTIVDTPGFGDTSGIGKDQAITDQIDRFFRAKDNTGLDHISAIAFVAQSSLARLTISQRYIFDSILSLFGKDISDNIVPLLTFADGQPPQILEALKAGKIPFVKHFKFNSSALFVSKSEQNDDEDEEEDDFDQMFWKMGMKSYKTFFQAINTMPEKSLLLTKELLGERERLQYQISGINRDIESAVFKLNVLDQELDIMKKFESEIDKNKDFTYIQEKESVKVEKLQGGLTSSNCIQCNYSCHDGCPFSDEERYRCWIFSGAKHCSQCPRKCYWSEHKNFPFRYVIQIVKVEKTLEDLKKRYQTAEGEKVTKEKVVHGLVNDVVGMQKEVISKSLQAKNCINRIKEIALKPNPLSTVEYVDMMIKAEETGDKPGRKKRIEQLYEVRKTAIILEKLSSEGYDPFKNQSETIAKVKERYEQNPQKRERECCVQ